MRTDESVVIIAGVVGIVFTYWFFLGKKGQEVAVSDEVDIIVDGGYSPEVISVPAGKITKLNFIRKDKSSCLEEVVLSDFKIRKYLPLNQKITIEIKPEKSGEYVFHCGMNMFHGKIVVR